MPDEKRVRLRPLPTGEFRDGIEMGWNGRVLEMDFQDPNATGDLISGLPVEIETETKLFLGILQQRRGGSVSVVVEHSLDRTQLDSIREVWG